jgi:hypothetical protein
VRERRVSEVVARPNRSLDSCFRDRLPHVRGHLRCVERRPERRVTEHERFRRSVQARLELLIEDVRSSRPIPDRPPPGSRLGLPHLASNERAPDVQPALEHLDVLPPQREELAAPECRPEREGCQTPRQRPPFAFCGLGGVLLDLVRVQEPCDLSLG